MADFSRGIYRIPYKTGTRVTVRQDHLTHDPPTRVDLKGAGSAPRRILAAADGTIRFIVDRFGENRPDGDPCNNNYVWIEHPTGEWTKYSHFVQGSVTEEAGLSVGDRVSAGRFLGFEGNVGCAHSVHLHFEVAVPEDPADPIDSEGFIRGGNARNRVPWICGVPGATLVKGQTHTAAPCPPLVLAPTVVSFGSVPIGSASTRTLVIGNTTAGSLRVRFSASASGPFTWAAFDQVIPAGERRTARLTFRPAGHEIVRRTLTISSPAPGNPHTVGLLGKGPGGFSVPGLLRLVRGRITGRRRSAPA